VTSFFNARSAEEKMTPPPHLWILDIMLPDGDGFDLIKKIKKYQQNTPVIFISARDQELDRVVGLEMGSDDYIAKPFLPRELVIRTRKLLKRIYHNEEGMIDSSWYEVGPYIIEPEKRIVREENAIIDLTSKEFDLLLLFIKNLGRAFSRDSILNEVWGRDYFGVDRAVDDLVRRLRKRLPALVIETIYGYGYRMKIR
jgi:two-component system, OmpR family, response regulator CssR